MKWDSFEKLANSINGIGPRLLLASLSAPFLMYSRPVSATEIKTVPHHEDIYAKDPAANAELIREAPISQPDIQMVDSASRASRVYVTNTATGEAFQVSSMAVGLALGVDSIAHGITSKTVPSKKP